MSEWQKAFGSDELAVGEAKLWRVSPRQIAVFRTNGRLFAIDNRCPHEGYPLVDGHVDTDKCVLTCAWHNWKFNLENGDCVLGGDHVRSYNVKEEDGHIWVDLADSPELVKRVIDGLQIAFKERDFGRICREISRLYYMSQDPLDAVRKALEWSYDKFEFGTTHAYAAMADWLQRYRENDGDWERQLICASETVDHTAFDVLRQKSFPYEAAGDKPYHHDAVLAAVEAEDRAAAESMVQHALANGLQWKDLEPTYAQASLDHFNDFGHSAIYVLKARQLLQQLGPKSDHKWLALPLIRSLCYTTREDLLPGFTTHQATVAALQESGFGSEGEDPSLADPFPVTTAAGHEWLIDVAREHSPQTIYWSILQAICKSQLHYDTAYETTFNRPVTDNVGWLFFTHGITFSNAVRAICTSYPHLWPQGLSQMICMLGRNRRFLDLDLDAEEWIVEDDSAFWEKVKDTELDHGFRDPIFSAHVVKTSVAIEEEAAVAHGACKRWLLAALNRFLHSPLKQKHARRLARQAIDLVRRDYVES